MGKCVRVSVCRALALNKFEMRFLCDDNMYSNEPAIAANYAINQGSNAICIETIFRLLFSGNETHNLNHMQIVTR